MGKTPQALKMQEARQSTRDEFDRFCMEQFISEVYTRFANLIVKKMPKEITLRLFETEIEQLAKYYPDIQELVKGENQGGSRGTKIPANFFKNYFFDYEITPGSTYKIDQQTQASNLQFILEMAQNPTIKEALETAGKRLDIAETINRLLVSSGIQDSDKILIDIPQEQPVPEAEVEQLTMPPAGSEQIDPQLLEQLQSQAAESQPMQPQYSEPYDGQIPQSQVSGYLQTGPDPQIDAISHDIPPAR